MAVRPTPKQAKALRLIREGKTPRSAMMASGYSVKTASHPSANLLRTPGAASILTKMQDAYAAVGITPEYLTVKQKEWIEATKRDQYTGEIAPDYQTQLKAAQFVRQDFGLVQQETFGANIKDGEVTIVVKRG